MEALLVAFIPLVLLIVGFSFLTGRSRSLTPWAVTGSVISLLLKTIAGLWQDRERKIGGGHTRRPSRRYRRCRQGCRH